MVPLSQLAVWRKLTRFQEQSTNFLTLLASDDMAAGKGNQMGLMMVPVRVSSSPSQEDVSLKIYCRNSGHPGVLLTGNVVTKQELNFGLKT